LCLNLSEKIERGNKPKKMCVECGFCLDAGEKSDLKKDCVGLKRNGIKIGFLLLSPALERLILFSCQRHRPDLSHG
jgi:hypothetical protein